MLLRLIMLFMVALIPLASAQNYFALPKHDSNDPSHWYDWYCCHLQDCGPEAGRTKVEGGWIVANKQGLMAFLPDDYMTNTEITKKPSRDAETHICITLDMRKASDGKGRISCVYIPMNT